MPARDLFCPQNSDIMGHKQKMKGKQRGENQSGWGLLATSFEVPSVTPGIFSGVWLGSVQKCL